MPLDSPLRIPAARTFATIAGAAAIALFAGCGGGSDGASSSSGSGDGGGGNSLASASTGSEIFQQANCVSCHTLAAEKASGVIGPNLDKAKPSAAVVSDKVTNGDGSMPAFKGRLTAEQIQTVSDYVAEVAGK